MIYRLIILWVAVLACATSSAAREERHERADHNKARGLKQSGEILPLERILERANKRHKGKVLETELVRRGPGYIYEIELVDQRGIVWEMKFDAKTGALLETEQEN